MYLLFTRLIVVGIRPVAVFAELIYVEKNDAYLPFVLPIIGLMMMSSSIPIHLDYYKSFEKTTYVEMKSLYTGNIISVCSIFLIIVLLGNYFLGAIQNLWMSIILCGFILEKTADELSRILEFQKKFLNWFLVQTIRSTWQYAAIIAYMACGEYASWSILFIILSTLIILAISINMGLYSSRPKLDIKYLISFHEYIPSQLISALYTNFPKLVIGIYFSSVAHAYNILGQSMQIILIVYNVKMQVPYRKIITRKTKHFFRVALSLNSKLIVISLICAGVSLFIYIIQNILSLGEHISWISLSVLMVSEAILIGIFSSYLGYVQWLIQGRHYAIFTLKVLAFAIVIFGVLMMMLADGYLTFDLMPIFNISFMLGTLPLLTSRIKAS